MTGVRRGRRVLRACALVAATALLSAGCASIPDHGVVTTIAGDVSPPDAPARIKPAMPIGGATPTEVANGFLLAMMASPVRYDIARSFLTPDAAANWKPRLGATIYSQAGLTAPPESGGTADTRRVTMDYTQAASLSERGRYTAVGQSKKSTGFGLRKVDGQWRIANPPAGVLISQEFFEGYYLPLNLYFFDRPATQVLADPIYVPDGDQVSTSLMTSLLRGPEGLLDGQAQTFVPSDLRLDVSAPVRPDGVADVKLRGRVSDLSASERERLAAQIVWTIRQVPSVTGVRITIDGAPLAIPGVDPVQSVDTWDRFDVSSKKGSGQLFAFRAGKLVVLDGSTVNEFAGPWGSMVSDLVDFRVNASLTRIAVVPPGRRVVRVAPLSDAGASKPAYSGVNVLRPTWDSAGNLWVADRTQAGTTLTTIDTKGGRRTIATGALGGLDVTTFEISPDGSRFLAVAHQRGRSATLARVYVGGFRRDPANRVTALSSARALPLDSSQLSSPLSAPLSAGWRSATAVAVLASLDGTTPQAYIASVDGSSVTGASLSREAPLGDIGATAVVASGVPEAATYVADSKGRLWLQNPQGRWQQVGDARLVAPSYPG